MMMVQFDMESCKVHDIEHLNDCTDEEVAAKWLTRMEWNEIRNGYTSVVKLLLFAKEGEELFDETDEQNTFASLRRGLEPWMPQFADVKNEAIDHAVRAVLDEQELQYQDNIHDDDLLAEIYCNYLGNSTERAYRMALDDEEVAIRIYKEDDEEEVGRIVSKTLECCKVTDQPTPAAIGYWSDRRSKQKNTATAIHNVLIQNNLAARTTHQRAS